MKDIIGTILVVDDEVVVRNSLSNVVEVINLERARANESQLKFVAFSNVDDSCEWVRSCSDPFLSILDHDLGDPARRTGLFISECIRREHSLGLLLPIMYYSGRYESAEFIDERISHGDMSPTLFFEKGDAKQRIKDVIRKVLEDFDQKWALALTQSSQQALMTLRIQEERNESE
jgi:CheY-like chemotaxis protein